MGITDEVLSLPLTDSSDQASNSSQNLEQLCLQTAKQIFSCYRKDDAVEPDSYIAAVAAVLSEYSVDVIERQADPRTGIARRSKFLPNAADIAEDCDKIATQLATDQSNREFQKKRAATPRYIPVVIQAPNLFVPSDQRDYERMSERAETESSERYFFEKNHLCLDGVKRDGIWIPLSWWEERTGVEKMHRATQSLADPVSSVIGGLK